MEKGPEEGRSASEKGQNRVLGWSGIRETGRRGSERKRKGARY